MREWTHIPANHSVMLPEQWQCRVRGRTVAAVLRAAAECARRQEWHAVMVPPDESAGPSSLVVTNCDIQTAKAEVEMALVRMGWR